MKEEGVTVKAKVLEVNGFFFLVELENGHKCQAYLSGKMRKHFIRTIPDDEVLVEISPYDFSRGRIVFREKGGKK